MKIKNFLNRYSAFALFSVVETDLLAYYGTHIANSGREYHDITSAFDKKIPFVPEFIIVYVLAFVQWLVCYCLLAANDKKKTHLFCTAASIANLICGAVFIAFPTIMTIRPDPAGSGLVGFLVRFIFTADNPPVNLFPSMHCLESYMCLRIVFSLRKVKIPAKILNLVFSVLVFLSVVFVKQHLAVDIIAGFLAAEAGIVITKAFKLDRKFLNLESKLLS